LGEFYLNLRLREISLPLSVILRNLPFLMVAVPLAARSTEFHYNRAITMAEKVGAKGMQGQAYLGLARLFHRQGQQPKAIDAIGRSLALFEMCEAEGFYPIRQPPQVNNRSILISPESRIPFEIVAGPSQSKLRSNQKYTPWGV
jgi:hypothetical protein